MAETEKTIGFDADTLWDKKQAALYLNLSAETIKKMVKAKKIPFIKLSARCTRFRKQDLDRWLSERTITPYKVPLRLVMKGG